MILITGASSGIGEACAEVFAKQGKNLLLVARRFDRLTSIAVALQAKYGVTVRTFELDVGDREAVKRFSSEQDELLKKISVLINNAGLAKGFDPIQSGDLSDWDAMIDTNLKGLLYMTRALVPHLITAGSGHVVNIGSVAGHHVYPKGNVYCATKHAVRALTEALRLDLSGSGVRVTEISPGMVETEFSQVRLGDEQIAKAVYAGMTPLSAMDVAETVAWCVGLPRHVNVQELILYPTDQASPWMVHRS